jgi:hypothetical protein
VRRALKILDTLLKLLEKLRLEVRVGTNEPGPYERARKCTFATDRRERVEITIKEKTKQYSNPAWDEKNYSYSTPRYLYQSIGQLTLSLDEDKYSRSARNWNDHKGHTVEEYLEEIASTIHRLLEDKHRARLAAEENRKREMEREKLWAEQQRQDKEEAERVEQLKLWAKAWHECEQLRAFVAEWERRTEANSEIQVGSPADAFRRWALLAIDRLDPLRAK